MTASLLADGAAAESLRVLLLEDSAEDAELVVRELRRMLPDCQVSRVDTPTGFQSALTDQKPQLILSDHRLSGFSGMHALEMARERTPDTPFIFVSGSLDEETAVECVKAGAWDYVLKDRLVRLGPAVRAALELRRTRDALKRSQEALLHTQKMDALGRLAGGVAHDYNNLMTAVLGFCYLIGQSLDEHDPRKQDLAEIRRAAERAAALTDQLLAFSRKQVITLQPVQLNEVIEGTERLLGRLIGERVTLVCRCAERLPPVHSDRGQLEQVIMNLAVNGRDAMPGGGALTIATREVPGRHDDGPSIHEAPRAVRLTVSDTGIGMSQDVAARVFEPYFTTKGEGTGLGLPTVYGIVTQAGGRVSIVSTPGAGTTVRVDLPATTDAALTPRSSHPDELQPATGETILLVEDEAIVREPARRMLERHGYTVLSAGSAAEALAIVHDHAGPIHLLLTDVVMPGRSGKELSLDVARLRPATKVLFTSGYSQDVIAHQGVLEEGVHLLAKPSSALEMLGKVRDVLDGAG